jgi:2-polyprenyl-3-methyl-5-hydroxy-6-metoxy-1,4-benzoquinol methylase
MLNSGAEPDDQREPRPLWAVLLRKFRSAWRFASDAPYRHMLRLLWRPPEGVFQPFNDTQPDRYPAIFKFVQQQLGSESDVKILSFGCATGEEVFSLRQYFPRAAIKGIDANRGNIVVAQRRLRAAPDPGLSFAGGASARTEPAAFYDAIFCMAVLRHGSLGASGATRCDHLIKFETFAAAIADFHRCLKPGGLLIVRHSNFRVSDTPLGTAFETILRVPLQGAAGTPIFGPDNVLIPDADDPDTVFRKL